MTTDRGGASFLNGLFYGAAAYVGSLVYVYAYVANYGSFKRRVAASLHEVPPGSVSEAQLRGAELFIPSKGLYSVWLHQYAMGGSVGAGINLFPGSYTIRPTVLFPMVAVDKDDHWIGLVTDDPMRLPSMVETIVTQDPATFGLFSVTPSLLFMAGALMAYRHQELQPLDGALAGAKVTIGFLIVSAAAAELGTASISGITFGAGGELSTGVSGDIKLFEAEIGSSISGSVDVEPVITIGPGFVSAIIVGFVLPMVFATAGGIAGWKAGAGSLVRRAVSRFVS